ncbi:MAG: hypothetical protein MUF11_07585 [Beijerinckiaceae bacterium]|jgi:hypothetical protein|nr:hypothetical protein [Beijerinckiaceae bacterium]
MGRGDISTARMLALGAGLFGLVFAAGFALGAIRVVLLQPYLGAGPSRLLELPLMVLISFLAARQVMRRAGAMERIDALTIGLIAFFLLLLAEMLLGRWLFRLPYSAILTDALTPIGFLNLLAQSLLIVFPALIAGWERTSS